MCHSRMGCPTSPRARRSGPPIFSPPQSLYRHGQSSIYGAESTASRIVFQDLTVMSLSFLCWLKALLLNHSSPLQLLVLNTYCCPHSYLWQPRHFYRHCSHELLNNQLRGFRDISIEWNLTKYLVTRLYARVWSVSMLANTKWL